MLSVLIEGSLVGEPARRIRLTCGGSLRLCTASANEFPAVRPVYPSTYPTKGIPDVH
jgi:hypothetical protein